MDTDFRHRSAANGEADPRRWPKVCAYGLLALGLALGGCGRHQESPALPEASTPPPPPGLDTGQQDPVGKASDLERYLAGPPAGNSTFGFERIEFAVGRSEVSPAGIAELVGVARVLNQPGNARVRVEISTHANMRGDLAAALALAQARAETIKAVLVGQGVAANRIEAVPSGIDSLDRIGPTAPGPVRNRRAEISVIQR